MKKNIYCAPQISVKFVDSENILDGSGPSQNTNGVETIDTEEDAGSKASTLFDTDDNDAWD